MPIPATLYDPFVDQIANLIDTADSTSGANLGIDQRKWRIPENWGGDPFDIAAIADPFDRSEINSDYQDSFEDNDGRIADAMAIKLQGDHLGCQERAFRLRHASAIRCTMHAANRRNGHSDSSDGVFARVLEHIQDVIIARGAGD